MKTVVLNLVLIALVSFFSVPLLFLYVLVFFGIGGGWAYAGSNGCHFVIGPFGYAMLIVPALGLFGVARGPIRRLRCRR